VDDAAFLDCVRASLPHAWDVIAGLVTDLDASGGEFADNQVSPAAARTAAQPTAALPHQHAGRRRGRHARADPG
jgi:hypothetical protein